jgi:hypothetical protein
MIGNCSSIIGLDLAKNVFQAHGARGDGSTAFRKKISVRRCYRFLLPLPSALARWKPAPARAIGRGRSARWAMRCG